MKTIFETDLIRQAYDRDNDKHVFAVDKLVHELQMPAEEVNKCYREILEEMKTRTTRSVLPCLVSSGVRKRLRRHAIDQERRSA